MIIQLSQKKNIQAKIVIQNGEGRTNQDTEGHTEVQ